MIKCYFLDNFNLFLQLAIQTKNKCSFNESLQAEILYCKGTFAGRETVVFFSLVFKNRIL